MKASPWWALVALVLVGLILLIGYDIYKHKRSPEVRKADRELSALIDGGFEDSSVAAELRKIVEYPSARFFVLAELYFLLILIAALIENFYYNGIVAIYASITAGLGLYLLSRGVSDKVVLSVHLHAFILWIVLALWHRFGFFPKFWKAGFWAYYIILFVGANIGISIYDWSKGSTFFITWVFALIQLFFYHLGQRTPETAST